MKSVFSCLLLVFIVFISGCKKENVEKNLLVGSWNFSNLSRINGKSYIDNNCIEEVTITSYNPKNQLIFNQDNSYNSTFSCDLIAFIVHVVDQTTETSISSTTKLGNGTYTYNASSNNLIIQDDVMKGNYTIDTLTENKLVFTYHYDNSYNDGMHSYSTVYDQIYSFTK